MPKRLIAFSDKEIEIAVGMAEYAAKKLQQEHDASYSGVDKLLYTGWIADAKELAEKFRSEMPEKEPEMPVEVLVAPEA